ncbi:YraN family protein [Sphingobacterium rhinopitheci]|uniref:YraN family protein n=1 Tax=Sphingobacterium rhinopitheci TaxID=2781960 RepID=UPI001F522493|nr:YraN family protein [Sphingobacterium rhinopitheci]MCI0920619.1 YraN family protein [Sphingobacterium rhinopitheci]
MSNQRRAGNKGEALASIYIQNLGYTIKTINWRYRYWEVDIIAMDGDTLVFVEVKSRTTTNYGRPEFFVDAKKQKNLIQAADAYLEMSGYQGDIRFDIVSVYLGTNKIELIKDAFWSN